MHGVQGSVKGHVGELGGLAGGAQSGARRRSGAQPREDLDERLAYRLLTTAGMDQVFQFRKRATECRDLAKRERGEGRRVLLLHMAEHWEALADLRTRLVRSAEAPRGE